MMDKGSLPKLKKLDERAVAAALAKAAQLRLHYESDVAESICRDVLAVYPEHQEALVALILCLTDQFREGRATLEQARHFIPSLHRDYERHYYLGVIYERWARSLHRRMPHAVALEWYVEAMRSFDKARTMADPGNEEALLRWNACLRSIHADEGLRQSFGSLWHTP